MPANHTIELSNPYYLPVIKDSCTYYGGSQMWFPKKSRFSKDYILRTYGCGTIATADILLYLAMQNEALRTDLTSAVLQNRIDCLQQSTNKNTVYYESYVPYVRKIDRDYTHTRHIIAVLGPKVARAINSYSHIYNLGLKASWRWKLTYYDMLEIMEEMLGKDIPVILSIGPNCPNLWGKKGIAFYERREIDYYDSDGRQTAKSKPYYYQSVEQAVNGHYVVVTGIIKDEITSRIMLRISSWGKMYYINYEEYRDYIDTASSTWLSSLVQIKRKV
ncbi:MAG: hypothetical protein GX757_01225 [Clostridiales bacterium]|nr:hypothetical protein [Clostridiales bacterium]